MSIVPISKFLTDFGVEVQTEPIQPQEEKRDKETAHRQGQQAEIKQQKENDAAIVASVSEIRQEMEARFEAQLEEEKKLARARFDKQVEGLETELAQRLAVQLTSGLDEIEKKISDLVASVLKPFIAESIEEKITAELKVTLDKVIRDARGGQIILRGRKLRLEKLQQQLGDLQGKVLFTVQDADEVTVESDDVWIESQFTSWLGMIDSAGNK